MDAAWLEAKTTESKSENSSFHNAVFDELAGGSASGSAQRFERVQFADPSVLQNLILQGLTGGRDYYRGAPGNPNSPEAICESRHMSFNECYDFKHLSPRQQYEYDRLQSNQDREEYLRENR